MKLGAGGADLLGQPPFDRKMDILVGQHEVEPPGADFGFDLAEPPDDSFRFSAADQPDLREHPRMRDRAPDVVAIQAPIERKRRR